MNLQYKTKRELIKELKELREANNSLKASYDNIQKDNHLSKKLLNFNAIILLIEPESGLILDANDAAVNFYGWKKEDLLKMTVDQINILIPEEIKIKKAESIKNNQNCFVCKPNIADGSIRHVEVYHSNVQFKKDILFSLIIHDITDRKSMEQLLKLNEFKFRTFTNYTIDWEYLEDANNNISYMSPSCERITGYTNDEFISEPGLINKIVHPDDQEYVYEHHKNAYLFKNRDCIDELEFRNVKKEDTIINILHTCRPIFDDDREFQGRQVTNTDITKRKKTQDKLQENEIEMNAILQSTADGILAVDSKGKVIKTNKRFSELWQIPEDLIDSGNDEDLIDFVLEQLTNPEAFIAKVQKLYQSSDEDLDYLYFKDGRIFERVSAPMFMSDSSVGRVWFFRDITELKKAETEIKLKNEKLLKANSEKDKFFSIIAHDLKSPFSSIIGFSDLLIEQISTKDYSGIDKYAEIIQQSANSAMDLLMNLMEWAQSQTGRMEFNPEYFELAELINNTQLLLIGASEQKSISLSKIVHSKALVLADKKMISTVLRNLISNAIKFTHPKGKISISVEEMEDELLVSVSDNGIGISKEDSKKLFKIDESYSTPGTKNEKGTGLGLILCKEFVEKHSGKIWVESEVGKGSTFKFSLPLYKA